MERFKALKQRAVSLGMMTPDDEGAVLIASNILDWISKFRPLIGAEPQNFDLAPFWIDVLLDPHPNISCTNGRQTYKSTNAANIVGYYSTTTRRKEISYIVDNEERKASFSEKRLREDTFLSNETLQHFLPHGRANVGRLKLTNGTIIYLLTDEQKYKNVEGKSNIVVISDEHQKQESQFFGIVMYTLSQTRGRLYKFGIGGEAGSPWHSQYMQTDQRMWIFDDSSDYTDEKTGRAYPGQGWRHKLKFDKKGDITNTPAQLKKILAGKWISQEPNNEQYRGYWMPQDIFATIPLTINDAITKYKMQPELSIEYQEKHYPKSMFMSHCRGMFYKANRRPITPEMVRKCYDHSLSLMTPDEIGALKQEKKNEILLFGGVDWGSGPAASSTVGSILIYWRKTNRYQLAWIDRRPEENTTVSAGYFAEVFKSAQCDYVVADLGYGDNAVPLLQKGGTDITGKIVQGLGMGKCMGCWTTGNPIDETQKFQQETDEHGVTKAHITIDHTQVIQNFVDFIDTTVEVDGEPATQFIIPMANDWETDFLLEDFCATTRRDLNDAEEIAVDDPREKPRKQFNHPRDTMMSIIYCMVGKNNHNPGASSISLVVKKR